MPETLTIHLDPHAPHRRRFLPARLDPVRLSPGSHIPRSGRPPDRQRQHRRHQRCSHRVKGLAIATLLLDALKGYAAVHVCVLDRHRTFPNTSPITLATLACTSSLHSLAFCAILGHMFPVWLRFKGGKGVATALGAFPRLSLPLQSLVALVVFVAIVAVTRYVSLGSIVARARLSRLLPGGSARTRGPRHHPVSHAASSLLIIVRHKDNIRRLLAGNENRFGGGKSGAA